MHVSLSLTLLNEQKDKIHLQKTVASVKSIESLLDKQKDKNKMLR